MFNLIVSGAGWKDHSDDFPADRVFEHTSEDLIHRFVPGGCLDIAAIRDLPTILMEEGSGDELAWFVRLTEVRRQGGSYLLRYAKDQTIPPITNASLWDLARDLGIDEWEFSRTHWAVKEANLYEALYRLSVGHAINPKVFNLPDAPVECDLIAVMMPFAPQFDDLYAALVECSESVGFRCQRADDIWLNEAVIEDVVHLIATACIVIADLTGKNANVFYETGIAHTLGKDVVLITQSKDDVPFDLRHLRYIPYLDNGEGRATLVEQLQRRLNAIGRG